MTFQKVKLKELIDALIKKDKVQFNNIKVEIINKLGKVAWERMLHKAKPNGSN